jgi:hypothetical protein
MKNCTCPPGTEGRICWCISSSTWLKAGKMKRYASGLDRLPTYGGQAVIEAL